MTTDEGVRATPWPASPAAGADADRLITALRVLRAGLGEVRLELPLRGGDDAAEVASGLANQIDDYLVPRLTRPETPPLLVIGGSTGGGKSTLLNTLIGEVVSPAGVLRPTTRSAVLVCHPDDFGTFLVGGPVPALPRTVDGAPGTVRVLESAAVPAGLALVDAPDVDSVEAENRRLAVRLLGAADLWIFVTTAARYADAVPWELLRSAVARGAAVAVVLSRVNHLAHATVSTHLRELLRAEGLGAAPLFVIEQTALEEHGLLPEQAVRSLRMWTGRISASASQRAAIVRQTLSGALASISDRVDAVADATKAQQGAVTTLRGQIGQAYAAAEARLRESVEDGVLFQGDIIGRWQEYAGNGGLTAILETRAGTRDGVLTGQSSIRAARVRAGLVGGIVRLFTSIADSAADELLTAWRSTPGGASVAESMRARSAAGEAAKRGEDVARAWLDDVDASIARADGTMRAGVMPVVVSAALQEGTLPVGREVDVAGGTVTLSAELLAEVFEDDDVQAAGRTARADLLTRLGGALAAEQRRFAARLDELEPSIGLADRMRDAARAVEKHRTVVEQLFPDPTPAPSSEARPGASEIGAPAAGSADAVPTEAGAAGAGTAGAGTAGTGAAGAGAASAGAGAGAAGADAGVADARLPGAGLAEAGLAEAGSAEGRPAVVASAERGPGSATVGPPVVRPAARDVSDLPSVAALQAVAAALQAAAGVDLRPTPGEAAERDSTDASGSEPAVDDDDDSSAPVDGPPGTPPTANVDAVSTDDSRGSDAPREGSE